MKKLINFALLSLVVLAVAIRVQAASLSAGKLSISYQGSGPLFNVSAISPGQSSSRIIQVKNDGSSAVGFSIGIRGNLGSFADSLVFTVKDPSTDKLLLQKSLSQVAKYPEGDSVINSISAGQTDTVEVMISLPSDTDNTRMGQTTNFDFIFGTETPSATSTAIDQQTATNIGNILSAATTQLDSNQGQTGNIKGVSTNDKDCYWWWVLLVIYAVSLTVYGYFAKKRKFRFNWFWPLMTGAILADVHWLLHNYFTPVRWCDYFIYYELVLFAIYYSIVNLKFKRKRSP